MRVVEEARMGDSEGAYASMTHLLNIAVVDLGIGQAWLHSR
ncbi:hypothetical protein ACFSX5_00930 [Devosia albogilva]|uniref:Uncharacterized protein n=1 Tax=Devosia albogilva TaxID=429726 RepID=A0ABW5QEX3_9HYPH